MKNKIYIDCPGNAVAGGVESLFQLADAINNLGGDAIMLWDAVYENPVPERYKKYHIKDNIEVEDIPENWVIYPEVSTEKIGNFKNMKNCVWWLSVTNNHGKFKDFSNYNIIHFYQSFFALDFLQKNRVANYLPLFDYISESYTKNSYDKTLKENIISYYPLKGGPVSVELIKMNPQFEFVPLLNIEEFQMIELLKKSKIYIDFGHHPGRDRIPREAVTLGNCVLTNKKGSAGFFNDIPIPMKYKKENLSEISDSIKYCLENYENCIDDFSIYRSTVKNQKEQLFNLCKQTFGL